MRVNLTKQDILKLLEKQSREFDKRLKKEQERRTKVEEERRARDEIKRARDTEKRARVFDKEMKKLSKKIAEVSGTLGRFVEGLVEPKIIEMFNERNIFVREIYKNVEIYRNGQKEAEIDLLLVNSDYSVAVEAKSTLDVDSVNQHLRSLDRLSVNPIRAIQRFAKFITN